VTNAANGEPGREGKNGPVTDTNAGEYDPALYLEQRREFQDRTSTDPIHKCVLQILVAELLTSQSHSVDIAG
jgi:hypothetical protein